MNESLRWTALQAQLTQQLIVAVVLLGLAGPLAAQDRAVNAGKPTEPVAVKWQRADQVFVYPLREAQASVLARNESRLSAELSAVIESIVVDVGQQVAAGDVLALLDPTDAELALAQVQAQLNGLRARLRLAQAQLKRARELKTNNFVSTDAVNQRSAEVVSLRAETAGAQAQVAIAQRRLLKAQIRAPFDAVVSARQAQLGELTTPGAILFTLVELGGEQVAAQMAYIAAAALSTDGVEQFEFMANGLRAPVTLLRVSPVISRQTRTREARFAFVESALAPGTEGRLIWRDGKAHIPSSLLVRRASQLGVFVVQDATAVFVAVTGAQEGRPAATTLPPQSAIVVSGQERLQPGQSVEARQFESAGAAASAGD